MNFTLKENAAGYLLLTAEHEGETLCLSSTAGEMARYLNIARHAIDLSPLQDACSLMDEIDEEDAADWKNATCIADTAGLYREAAGANGLLALMLAELENAPLAELERCSNIDEIAALVEDNTELVSPETFTAGRSAAARCRALALDICRLMFSKENPTTFDRLRVLVWGWDAVCRSILHCSRMDLLAFNAEDGDCAFSAAEYLQLTAENCDIADDLADLCERVLGSTVHREFDGSHAWYDFPKNVKES